MRLYYLPLLWQCQNGSETLAPTTSVGEDRGKRQCQLYLDRTGLRRRAGSGGHAKFANVEVKRTLIKSKVTVNSTKLEYPVSPLARGKVGE